MRGRTAFPVFGSLFLALALAVSSFGCASQPQALNTAVQTYTSAVQTLTTLRQDGLISDQQAVQIEGYRQTARAALDAWRTAYDAGGSTVTPAAVFATAMTSLSNALLNAQKSEVGSQKSTSDIGHPTSVPSPSPSSEVSP